MNRVFSLTVRTQLLLLPASLHLNVCESPHVTLGGCPSPGVTLFFFFLRLDHKTQISLDTALQLRATVNFWSSHPTPVMRVLLESC